MKLVKWLIGIVLALVVLVMAAVIVLPMVIDPNDYKGDIIAAVKERTGRDLELRDPLELSVFPTLAVRLGGVSLSNAPGFGDAPFAKVEKLDLRVDLMPLLSKRIEVNTVTLDGLALNLQRNVEGRSNWDDLAGDAARGESEPKPERRKPDGGPVGTFTIQGVQITDANILWDDRQAGQRYDLTDVRLVTGEITPGSPVQLEGGLKFGSSKPQLNLTLGVSGTVSVSEDLQRAEVAGLVLDLFAIGEGLPEAGATVRVSSDVSLDQAAKSLALKKLVVDGGVVTLNGDLEAAHYDTKPALRGEIELKETDLRKLLALLGVTIETTDPDVLKRLSGKFSLASVDQGIAVRPLTLNLDDSSLKGFVEVPVFDGPVVRTELTLDQIDVDRYLPPTKAGAKPGEGTPAKQEASTAKASDDPLAPLRPLDLKADLKVGKIKINNAHMSDFSMQVRALKGVLTMDPIAAKLYQGGFAGKVRVDATAKTPKMKVEKHLTGIQIGPLLKDVVGKDRLTGKGEVHADVSMSGLTDAEIKKTLNGNMRMQFTDGAVKGVNLAELIRNAQSALTGGGAATSDQAQTDFSEVSASAVIRNGVIDNQDLQAKSPLLRVDGKGKVNLPANNLDYLLVTELVKSLEGQGGKGRDELTGLPIPVRFTGSLDSPKPQVDLQAALSAKTKQTIEKKKAELQQSVEKKVQEKVGDKLKGLFGR